MREIKRLSDLSDEEKEVFKKLKSLATIHKQKTGYMPQHGLLLRLSVFRKDVSENQDTYDSFIKRYRKFGQSLTKERFVFTYGETEGLERWNHYCSKQAETNTFEYKQKVYGMTEEEFKEYNSSRAVTLENLINRHGKEKGTQIFESYREKQRTAGISLEYFQNKLGEKEGEDFFKELNKKKGTSLLKFHGKRKDLVSDSEEEFIKKVESLLTEEEKKCGERGHRIWRWSYDYINPLLSLCIEYNGIAFHMKPSLYKADHPYPLKSTSYKTASDIWAKDERKKQAFLKKYSIPEKGYIVVWSDEEDKGLKQVEEYINEARKNK